MKAILRSACLRVVTAIFLLAGPVASPAAVVEPSAIPAMPSRLAATRPLVAVTTAGARLVAAGQHGHIVYSDDQGASWQQAKVPVSVDMVCLRFVDAKRGWAGGHDGVLLRTDDGGLTWTRVFEGRELARSMVEHYEKRVAGGDALVQAALEESRRFVDEQGSRPLLDIWFENEKTGFVIGAWNLIFRTDDGGQTWLPWLEHVDNPRANHLNAMARVGAQLWMVGEQGLMLRYDPAVQRFVQSVSPTPASLFGITGSDRSVVVFGLAGQTYVSTDGGASWTASAVAAGTAMTGGAMLGDGRVVLVDAGAGLWVSEDAGRKFKRFSAQRPMSFFSVAVAAGERLVLAGMQGVQVEQLEQLEQLGR